MSSHYFVTTPIFYVNGSPHIGHLQSCLYADAFARINRLLGKNVIFSTGTDEHGLKVQQAADSAKKSPYDYCSTNSKNFQDVLNESNISFTHFIRTTDERHKIIVQKFWRKLHDNGCIRKGKYEGWYSINDEAYVPSSQVKEVKEGSVIKMVSAETGAPVEQMCEENYVFPLSNFQNELLYWLSKDVIKPTVFADNVRKRISEGLFDLSVSRPKSRLSWGIPVPDDDSQVIYVWLDALLNYVTVGEKYVWPPTCHVIGKDILKFHAIYWPAFLIAAGYEPPEQIFCHSHWTVNYEKMSKSKGNVIDPVSLMDKYGCEGFRYFLLNASVPHSDTNYSETKIHRMLNAELADTLGNLLSRCCAKAVNAEQVFPVFYHKSLESFNDSSAQDLINATSKLPGKVKPEFIEGYFYRGIDCIMECLSAANAFMQFQKPWELARGDDSISKEKLSTVLHIIMEVLRVSGILLKPIIPNLSSKLLTRLGVPEPERQWVNLQVFPSYFNLPNPSEGNPLGADSKPLYERRREDK